MAETLLHLRKTTKKPISNNWYYFILYNTEIFLSIKQTEDNIKCMYAFAYRLKCHVRLSCAF